MVLIRRLPGPGAHPIRQPYGKVAISSEKETWEREAPSQYSSGIPTGISAVRRLHKKIPIFRAGANVNVSVGMGTGAPAASAPYIANFASAETASVIAKEQFVRVRAIIRDSGPTSMGGQGQRRTREQAGTKKPAELYAVRVFR
jgi:hypothetical protein